MGVCACVYCFFHNNNDTNNNLNIFIQDCCFNLGNKTAINAGLFRLCGFTSREAARKFDEPRSGEK